MSGHVDEESLALYAEGELSHRRTAKVRAHLAGCTECTATVAALTEVTAQLSHVPAPPMPSVVAARLDAALSAESAHRAAASVPAGAPQPRPPRRNPLWSPAALRILAATGVTLVVAGGVGYAVSQSGSSGSASSSSVPPATVHRHSSIHAAPNSSPRAPQMQPAISPGSAGTRYVRSGTNYRQSTLAAQAQQKLAQPVLPAPASISGQVRHCVNLTAHGRPVRLVDLARYQQRPAIVIVLGSPDTVVVVSDSCALLHSAPLTAG
jgi:anti-sigma factor RsiW